MNKAAGDNVVIINAEKVKFTGNKLKDKPYRWHTGFPGGLKERTAEEQLAKQPTKVLRKVRRAGGAKRRLLISILGVGGAKRR